MALSVNINRIINVNGSVIAPANTTVQLPTLALTENPVIPYGNNIVRSFSRLADVGTFFGIGSDEYFFASTYFKSYDNKTVVPPAIYFARYIASASFAYLSSATLSSATQTQMITNAKALATPSMTFTINGQTPVVVTLTSAQVTAVSSLVELFLLIQAGLGATNGSIGLINDAVVVKANNTLNISEANSIINQISGNLAEALGIGYNDTTPNQINLGLFYSNGVGASTPAQNMDNITAQFNYFFTFTYTKRITGDTSNANYPISVGLANWLKTQTAGNYAFIPWETTQVDSAGKIVLDTTTPPFTNAMSDKSLARVFLSAGLGSYDQTTNKIIWNVPISIQGSTVANTNIVTGSDVGLYASFIGGCCASADFSRSRISLAGKYQTGLVASVQRTDNYDILLTNGYNVYSQFSVNIQNFTLSETGSVGGAYRTLGQYLSAVWLGLQQQIAIANLIQNVPFLDYTSNDAKVQITAVLGNIITACKQNKIIQTGNVFSQDELEQITTITNDSNAGNYLTQNGYYLYFEPVTANQRATQLPLVIDFFYSNGGEVVRININNNFVE